MQPSHASQPCQQNTIQILITNTPSTACPQSLKSLYTEHQNSPKPSLLRSLIRSLDTFLSNLLLLLKTLWNLLLPITLRGPCSQTQVFTSYIQRMKLDIPSSLIFSPSDLQTTLHKNQIAILIAYTCNDYIKRDIKKLLKNKRLVELSEKYPLCPLNNYSEYFQKYVRGNIMKTYSVYLVAFGVSEREEVMMLGVWKPIDEEVVEKVGEAVESWRKEQREGVQGESGEENKNEILPKVRERHFSIPKVLELGDLMFQDNYINNFNNDNENNPDTNQDHDHKGSNQNFIINSRIQENELAKSQVIDQLTT